MKQINLEFTGPPLSLEQLGEFENEVDGHLPDDYKHFLLNNNGGMAEPHLAFQFNGAEHTIPAFDMLLPQPDDGLRLGLDYLRGFGISGFLQIASDLNEQDICLQVSGKDHAIFIASHEYAEDVPIDATMTKITDSFTDFLDMLYEVPDEICPIERLGRSGTPDELSTALQLSETSIDDVGKNDLSLICEAIKFNNLSLVQACIVRGANLSRTIHIATCNGQTELIPLLVEAGADVNEVDEFGDRPLSYVGGTELPGEEGEENRVLRDTLMTYGAVE